MFGSRLMVALAIDGDCTVLRKLFSIKHKGFTFVAETVKNIEKDNSCCILLIYCAPTSLHIAPWMTLTRPNELSKIEKKYITGRKLLIEFHRIKGKTLEKVEVLNSLIMKITAKENDVNDIFADDSLTAATIIRASANELQWYAASSCGQSGEKRCEKWKTRKAVAVVARSIGGHVTRRDTCRWWWRVTSWLRHEALLQV